MTARKTSRKAPAKKGSGGTGKAAGTSRKKTTKAAAGARRTRKKAAGAEAPKPATPEAPQAEAKPRPASSSLNVNLGHVFALRPKVSTSFRPADFHAARQRLQDETYASLEEAARAVVEKALELTREGGARRGPRTRR